MQLGLSPSELLDVVPGAHALVIRSATKVSAEVLQVGADLIVVGRAGIGLDNVDVEAATRRGVMWSVFSDEYLPDDPAVKLLSHETTTVSTPEGDRARVVAQMLVDEAHHTVQGEGNGPIDAFVHGLRQLLGVQLDVVDYSEHAVSAGADALAAAYVETVWPNGETRWGVGMDSSILTASLKAVVSAVNAKR